MIDAYLLANYPSANYNKPPVEWCYKNHAIVEGDDYIECDCGKIACEGHTRECEVCAEQGKIVKRCCLCMKYNRKLGIWHCEDSECVRKVAEWVKELEAKDD